MRSTSLLSSLSYAHMSASQSSILSTGEKEGEPFIDEAFAEVVAGHDLLARVKLRSDALAEDLPDARVESSSTARNGLCSRSWDRAHTSK